MKYDRFFCLMIFFIVINFIIIQSSCTAHSEFTLGDTWSYIIKLNGQPFTYTQITVIDEERVEKGKIWTIKKEYVYRIKLNKKHIDEYQGQTIIKLRDDFTLVSLRDTTKKNGSDFSYHSFKEEDNGYFFREKIEEEKSEGFIKTKKPLYLYGYTYPWLIEILARNNILTPQKSCSAISFSNKIISVKHLDDLALANDQDKYVCYMANNDKIYFNKDKEVVKIDSDHDGIVEFMSGEGFPEKELCYDLEKVIEKLISDVPFIKRDDLTSMTAYLNIGLGLESADYLQSPSARQNFNGAVFEKGDEIAIEGKVTVHKETLEPKAPFAFPVTIKWGSEFDRYLRSQPLVEVNDPEIRAKAEEITKDASNTWEAALAIARWVYDNTEYNNMFENLSALETLKEGKGVCGQFALLTTALCRAVKIPVRFVNGYAYGYNKRAFVLHAWVEVYTDENGWRSMDPTWGQFDFLDATHIGLSDDIKILVDVSSLKPRTIRVLAYTPQEAGPMPSPPLNISKLKIKGKELHYEIYEHEEKVGDYTGKINTAPGGNYCLTETLTIPHSNTKSRSELLIDEQGYILKYNTDGLWDGLKQEREFLFAEDLKFRATYGEEETQIETYRLLEDEVQVDLFRFMQWGLLAARLVEDVDTETSMTVTVFVADIPGYSNLKATIRPCIVKFGGSMDTGWFCVISGSRLKKELYITKDGVITRIDFPEIQVSAVLVE